MIAGAVATSEKMAAAAAATEPKAAAPTAETSRWSDEASPLSLPPFIHPSILARNHTLRSRQGVLYDPRIERI